MEKKRLVTKWNNQKGITGADVVLAVLIILTTVSVIAMVYVNLITSSSEAKRKTGASQIATNIIENMSQIYYGEMEETLSQNAQQENQTYTVSTNKIFNTKIPKGYQVKITLENDNTLKLVTKAIVMVTYTVDGREKHVDLTKVFEKEVIREVNSPNFSSAYLNQFNAEKAILYSDYLRGATVESSSGSSADSDSKIICPIRYNKQTKNYEIMSDTESLWYSYRNKEWARVVLLAPSEIGQPITDIQLKGDNSYLWIPKFQVSNGGNLFGDTYFIYKATDFAIQSGPSNSLRSDITWSNNRGIYFGEQVGKWCQYSDLSNASSVAYLLNQSQYGPMREY